MSSQKEVILLEYAFRRSQKRDLINAYRVLVDQELSKTSSQGNQESLQDEKNRSHLRKGLFAEAKRG